MRLTTIAAMVALTTIATTREAAARVRHHRHHLIETVALAPVAVEQPADMPSFLDQLLGKTQRVVEAPVRRINAQLNHLTGQAEGGHVQAIVTREAARAGVPQRIAHAVIRVESGYNCRARNRSGASGAAQLMPATARALGVRNPMDCRQNIAASMRYLHQAISRGGAGCAGVSLYNRGIGARPVCTAYGKRVMHIASM
jgi:soluble lytic murein transglycosylase-like protein